MTPSQTIDLLEYLSRAATSSIGIALQFESPEELRLIRAKLYTVRKEHPEYSSMSFSEGPDNELWIMKGSPDEHEISL